MSRRPPTRSYRSPLLLGCLVLGANPHPLVRAQQAPAPAATSIQDPATLIESSKQIREQAEQIRSKATELRRSGQDPEALRREAIELRHQSDELAAFEGTLAQAQQRLKARLNEPAVLENRSEAERLKGLADNLRAESDKLNSVRESLPQEAESLATRIAEVQLLADAAAINDPADRTLAYDRAARALLSGTSLEALEAIRQGRAAATSISHPTVRDVRIDNLAETAQAVGQSFQLAALAPKMRDPMQATLGSTEEPVNYLEPAREAFELAADLGSRIEMPDYQCNRLAQVATYMAKLSAAAANAARDQAGESSSDQPAGNSTGSNLKREADRFIVLAAQTAQRIPYGQWMNRAKVDLVELAADSGQFERAREMAESIALPRSRLESFVQLAEAQIKLGKPNDATSSYQRALDTLFSIEQPAIRETFGLLLYDSLLNNRRFDDARAVTTLIQNPELRGNALSLLAASMGEAGLDRSANQWIDQTVSDPALRDRLRRRVVDGYAKYVQDRRARGTEGGLSGGAPGSSGVPRDELRRGAEEILRHNTR